MSILENFKNRLIANSIKKSTAYQYVNQVSNFLKDQNISKPEEVNTDNIAAYIAKVKNEGKDGLANNFVKAVNQFVKLFQVDNVTIPKTKKYKRKKEPHPFSIEELQTICQHINNNQDEFGGREKSLRYIAAICTKSTFGMRISELCALDRLQFANGQYLKYHNEKSDSWVTVRLPKWLRDVIRDYFDTEQLKHENSNAFNISRRMVDFALKRAVEEHQCLGPGRNAYPHLLRHSNITILHDEGASLKDLAEMHGHKDIKHTETYITTSDKSRMDRMAPKLEKMKLFKMPKG